MEGQQKTSQLAIAAAALVLGAALAGCSGGADYQPTDRKDSNRVVLLANRGVEFKLFMRSGDTMQYSWFSTSSVDYDFHGEREGDKSGAFTSYKTNNGGSDSGSLSASFTGTHGWYWLNGHAQSVTITLQTDGVYDVVGEVAPQGR